MKRIASLLVAGLVAACAEVVPVQPVPVPPERPARPAPAAPAPTGPTKLSEDTSGYYKGVEDGFVARGLLRTDRGTEVTLTPALVARTFLNIAFYSEYSERGGTLVAGATASKMQRWERPVTVQTVFGPAVPQTQMLKDKASIASLVSRLARVSGHPISTVASGGNFTILVLTEDERRAYGPQLSRLVPGLSQAARRAILEMPRSTYCLVIARDGSLSDQYVQAVAVVRAEHPDLLRLSCFHEEITQGLGLANDDPRARPSIFNDDEEFALLTRLDEILLRILYDPRLAPGMTEAEARPIVMQIAEELVGQRS